MNLPKILMCAPEFYEVAYEINPWMSIRRKVNAAKARKQWSAYYDLLVKKLKVKVELIEPVRGLPDMVFTANGGLVHKRTFVKSSFRHKERRGEEPYFEKWFKKKGYIIKSIPKPHAFEGEGDALPMGKELFTGYHFRSDLEAHDVLSGLLRLPYHALELADKRFYHLDTCFAPLNARSAIMYIPAFAPYAQLVLLEAIEDPIRVPEEEAAKFACNAAVFGKNVVVPEGCPMTAKELEKRGFHVYPLNFSEFIKAGGAAKCLVLRI